MKKITLLVLALLLVLSLFSCQNKTNDNNTETTAPETENTNSTEMVDPETTNNISTSTNNPSDSQKANNQTPNQDTNKSNEDQKQNNDEKQQINLITYLEEKEGESATYNTAIKVYNEFLNEKIKAKDSKTGNMIGVNDAWNPNSGKPGIIQFGLFDVNHDGIPELHTTASTHSVFSYQNDQLLLWYQTGGSIMNGPNYILENGAIFSKKVSTGYSYTYTVFDPEGKVSEVYFHDPGTDSEGARYTFNHEYVTKEEYQQLTKEYMELSEKKATVEWVDYEK